MTNTPVFSTAKSLSTPADLTQGVIDTVRLSQVSPASVDFFVHGGTTVINAIAERKGARTALATRAGVRDVLEIQRGNRPDLVQSAVREGAALRAAPVALRGAGTRRRDGQRVPLNVADLDRVVERCRAEAVEVIAIQFLNRYVAPEHEAACAAHLRERLSGVAVTASHEIKREWREYERANTAFEGAHQWAPALPRTRKWCRTIVSSLHRLSLAPSDTTTFPGPAPASIRNLHRRRQTSYGYADTRGAVP